MLFHSRTADTAGFPETPGENINDGRTHAFQQSSRRQYPWNYHCLRHYQLSANVLYGVFLLKKFFKCTQTANGGRSRKIYNFISRKISCLPPRFGFSIFSCTPLEKKYVKTKNLSGAEMLHGFLFSFSLHYGAE